MSLASTTALHSGVDRVAAAAAIDAFLRAIGRTEPDVVGTGKRVADMFLDELCAGYAVDTRALLQAGVIEAQSSGLVVVRELPVATTCPHHLVPSTGKATVAFFARGRIVGLGAVAALVDAHARRLTLQETIGEGIVDDLAAVLAPEWVGCRLELSHACMLVRGEKALGARVDTVALRGSEAHGDRIYAALGVGGAR